VTPEYATAILKKFGYTNIYNVATTLGLPNPNRPLSRHSVLAFSAREAARQANWTPRPPTYEELAELEQAVLLLAQRSRPTQTLG
jgi:hypothetical protein